MTIATDRGFKIGELYRVIRGEGCYYYVAGMIVKFIEDDGSNIPWFQYVSGPKGSAFSDTRKMVAIPLDDLGPVQLDKKTYTNKELLLVYINQYYSNDKVLNDMVNTL